MALAQGLHFRDFAHWIRPWLCPSGDMEWWAPPFNPSTNNWDQEARFREWRIEGIWFVYAFTETENCDWLGLQGGYFRTTWTSVCIARIEWCEEYFVGLQGEGLEPLDDGSNSDA